MAMKTPFGFRKPVFGRLRGGGPAVGPRRRKSSQPSAVPSGVRQRRAFAVEECRGVRCLLVDVGEESLQPSARWTANGRGALRPVARRSAGSAGAGALLDLRAPRPPTARSGGRRRARLYGRRPTICAEVVGVRMAPSDPS